MKQSATTKLKHAMEPGRVYRRQELEVYSSSLSRNLGCLVSQGELVQAAPGLYYRPKMTEFGLVPATSEELVRAFLNDGDFLFVSFNEYNLLGVGLTQLHNKQLVYNRKRSGEFVLDKRHFTFKRPRNFPLKITKEFLMVDFLNNLDELSSNQDSLKQLVSMKVREVHADKLRNAAKDYGKVATRRFFEKVLAA